MRIGIEAPVQFMCFKRLFALSADSRSEEGLEDIITSGYTSVNYGENMKLVFNSQLANLTGLQSGSIYVTRYETFHKRIDLNGASFYDDETYNECGLRRIQDLEGDHFSYSERGYVANLIGANQIDLETYLIHVISDLSGKKLDIYFPCKPSEIKWHYYLYK